MTKQAIDTKSPEFRARAEERRRTWGGVTVHKDFDAIKTAEYAYWATQPAHVVMATVSEMTTEAYAMRGIRVSRLQRTPWRSLTSIRSNTS
jgi:hypothetical protein